MAGRAGEGTREAQDPWVLLFVAGSSPRSQRARSNLLSALEARGHDESVVEVIDALRDPQVVLEHRVFATPALVRKPDAGSVLYGDLSDQRALERFLAEVFP